MLEEVVGTLGGRWYVTAFGLAFVALASRHLGWKRMGIYAAAAVVVGAAAENGSVRYGIPYTRYSFDPSLRGRPRTVCSTSARRRPGPCEVV